MQNLYNQFKGINDSYEMQKKIALGLNNGVTYKPFTNNNVPFLSFLTQSSKDNNFNPSNSDIINVVFVTMKGNNHMRFYNKNMKIREMLEDFLTKFGLSKNSLDRVQFLYNATIINKLNMKLSQFNIVNNSKINVIDIHNVIGA